MIEGPTDIELLAEQIEQMKSITKNKSSIIKDAAVVLAESGKYDDDLTVIAAKLKRIWRDISPSLINKVLPLEYKRDYKADHKAMPNSLLQEFMTRMRDINLELAQVANTIIKHIQSDKRYDQDITLALTETLHDIHTKKIYDGYMAECGKIRDLKSLVEFTKVLQDDAIMIKQQTDWRTKIDLFMKYNIRRLALSTNLGSIAKHIHMSSKWLSETVNQRNTSDDVMQYVKELGQCPKCSFDMSTYFNRAVIALKSGNTIPKIS